MRIEFTCMIMIPGVI